MTDVARIADRPETKPGPALSGSTPTARSPKQQGAAYTFGIVAFTRCSTTPPATSHDAPRSWLPAPPARRDSRGRGRRVCLSRGHASFRHRPDRRHVDIASQF